MTDYDGLLAKLRRFERKEGDALSGEAADAIEALIREWNKFRAENEKLREALFAARDGLRWSKIHLRQHGTGSVSVEVALDATEKALERKPE
jgi:hypothetical protein